MDGTLNFPQPRWGEYWTLDLCPQVKGNGSQSLTAGTTQNGRERFVVVIPLLPPVTRAACWQS
jgi:hypothetical protein